MEENTIKEVKQKEKKTWKLLIIISIIEFIFFIFVSHTFFSTIETKELLELKELNFVNNYKDIDIYYIFIISFVFVINYLTLEIKILRKKIDKIILITFIILIGLSLQLKEIKIELEQEFIKSTKYPIEMNLYSEIKEYLIIFKNYKEILNNEKLNEQYNVILKIINNTNFPITKIEYNKFIKEKDKFYEIYNEIKAQEEYNILKEEYNKIKNFK